MMRSAAQWHGGVADEDDVPPGFEGHVSQRKGMQRGTAVNVHASFQQPGTYPVRRSPDPSAVHQYLRQPQPQGYVDSQVPPAATAVGAAAAPYAAHSFPQAPRAPLAIPEIPGTYNTKGATRSSGGGAKANSSARSAVAPSYGDFDDDEEYGAPRRSKGGALKRSPSATSQRSGRGPSPALSPAPSGTLPSRRSTAEAAPHSRPLPPSQQHHPAAAQRSSGGARSAADGDSRPQQPPRPPPAAGPGPVPRRAPTTCPIAVPPEPCTGASDSDEEYGADVGRRRRSKQRTNSSHKLRPPASDSASDGKAPNRSPAKARSSSRAASDGGRLQLLQGQVAELQAVIQMLCAQKTEAVAEEGNVVAEENLELQTQLMEVVGQKERLERQLAQEMDMRRQLEMAVLLQEPTPMSHMSSSRNSSGGDEVDAEEWAEASDEEEGEELEEGAGTSSTQQHGVSTSSAAPAQTPSSAAASAPPAEAAVGDAPTSYIAEDPELAAILRDLKV